MGAFRSVGYVAFVAALIFARGWIRYANRSAREASPEYALLAKIEEASSEAERQKLIAQLESLPNKEVEFFYLWMTIHDAWQLDAWTDEGFEPAKVALPRDIQLLAAAEFGVADFDNGGFSQFFGNDTGMFAPEMIEWFDRAGMPESADILRKAISRFGSSYPRSRLTRQKFLAKYERENREAPNPFIELDDQFYDALEGGAAGHKGFSFEAVANRWLRENCGITRLVDPPSAAKAR